MIFSLDLILFCSAIFLFASLFHGSIGFGFPMIATPLLALFMDIQSAIIITLVPTLLMNIVSIASEAHFNFAAFKIAVKKHFALATYALIGTVVGTLILIQYNSEYFKVLLAIAILVYLISEHIKLNFPWILQFPKTSKLVFGLLAGLLGGLTNVMAPILIIYAIESKKSRQDIIQASNLCFLFGKITQICLFTLSTKFTYNELSVSSLMLIVSAIGIAIGIQIKKVIKSDIYIKLLKLLLFSLAIIILFQFYY